MYKILVTGAAGFIGFHITQRLVKLNCEIVGLDNLNDYYNVQLKYDRLNEAGISAADLKENTFVTSTKYGNYRFLKLSIENKAAMKELFENEKFDVVVHLAAQAGVRYSLINPTSYIDSNVQGFLSVLEGCRYTDVHHLIFASSSSVYGANTKLPFDENDRTDTPVSLYAATKKANEMMAYSYSHLYKIKTTGLRFFTVYGPWGRPDMAYFIFTDKISKGEPIKLFNAGKMKRDFTFIDDIVQGITNIVLRTVSDIENNVPHATSIQDLHSIYNIGNHKSIEITKLVSIIEQYLGKKAVIEHHPMQPGDVENTYAEISKLNKAYNFVPHTDYEAGIKQFVGWYKEYYKV
jgi:UDP-glucuronate 4-epimerase